MPSATNSPMIGRKSIPTVPSGLTINNADICDVAAGTSTESTEQIISQKNRVPLSVASMVRRFERDGSSKTRAGSSSSVPRTASRGVSGTIPEIAAKYQQVTTPLSSRTSSLSSSQGFLNAVGGEKDGDDNIVGKEDTKADKLKDVKDNPKKSQIISSKSDNKSTREISGKEQKNKFSAKQDANVNEAVISDTNDSSKTSVCHIKNTNVQGDTSDNLKVEDGTSKKTPIKMTSVVRAATAPKDHQSSREHKAALTAKRRATAPTTNTAAAVKASRSNITNSTARNRTTPTKADTSTPSTSPVQVSTSKDTTGNLEEPVSVLSKKNIKTSPVRKSLFLKFHINCFVPKSFLNIKRDLDVIYPFISNSFKIRSTNVNNILTRPS